MCSWIKRLFHWMAGPACDTGGEQSPRRSTLLESLSVLNDTFGCFNDLGGGDR